MKDCKGMKKDHGKKNRKMSPKKKAAMKADMPMPMMKRKPVGAALMDIAKDRGMA